MEPPEECCKREGRNLYPPSAPAPVGDRGRWSEDGCSQHHQGGQHMAYFQCPFVGFASLEGDPLFRHVLFVSSLHQPGGCRRGTPGQGVPGDALRIQECELRVHQRGQLAVLEAESLWGDVPGPHSCLVIAPGASTSGTTWLPDGAPELSLPSPLG